MGNFTNAYSLQSNARICVIHKEAFVSIFTINNGITEGFHRKMKLIQRRAYGFRNFENYRLRVKVLCS
ncbi:transposase [Legionella nagasakiensis]|uniref:transposase n=1 Tax=Legionella nagasakiensis TaxID=535290 RepID=UPI002414E40A|nr:transposase [Legionella nagasakiensis]